MQLNPECIRGLLLTVEDNCTFNKFWIYEKDEPLPLHLANFSHDEILYHIKQASDSNLIQDVLYCDDGDFVTISDLTPKGHEFLANIRNESVWKKTLSKGADTSLPILLELAKDIALKHFLG